MSRGGWSIAGRAVGLCGRMGRVALPSSGCPGACRLTQNGNTAAVCVVSYPQQVWHDCSGARRRMLGAGRSAQEGG